MPNESYPLRGGALATLTLFSTVILCLLIVMWPVSFILDLSRGISTGKWAPSDSIPIASDYRFGIERGSIWLYTGEMPYRGSIIGIAFTNDPPPVVHGWIVGDYGFAHTIYFHPSGKSMSERFCDFPGIYFRRFGRFDDKVPWTMLRVSFWYPIYISTALPLLWIFRRKRELLQRWLPHARKL